MKDPLPWFPFYVDRFMSSRAVRRMTTEQIGAYMLLLIDQWQNGPIPDDDATITAITRLEPSLARAVLERCFSLASGEWANEKLEDVRVKQESRHRDRVEAGRKGGKAKAERLAKLKPSSSSALALDKNRIEENRKETSADADVAPASTDDFQELWRAAGKGSLVKAEFEYHRHVPGRIPHDDLLRRRLLYVSRQDEPRYIANLDSWMRGEAYLDPTLDPDPHEEANRLWATEWDADTYNAYKTAHPDWEPA